MDRTLTNVITGIATRTNGRTPTPMSLNYASYNPFMISLLISRDSIEFKAETAQEWEIPVELFRSAPAYSWHTGPHKARTIIVTRPFNIKLRRRRIKIQLRGMVNGAKTTATLLLDAQVVKDFLNDIDLLLIADPDVIQSYVESGHTRLARYLDAQ